MAGSTANSGSAVLDPPQESQEKEKRLNLIVSSSAFEDLSNLARERRTSMTEIVRIALGLVKVAMHEARQGNKLVVTTATGDVIKELILLG